MAAAEVRGEQLERIARLDAELGAVVTLDAEAARGRAAEADRALARGEVWAEDSPAVQALAALMLSQVSGCPMVVIPARTDSNGVPFGAQLIGPAGRTNGSWPSPRRSPPPPADSGLIFKIRVISQDQRAQGRPLPGVSSA